MARPLLRPAGFDDLGLRQVLGERMLPLLVAAMSFLGALAVAGSVSAASVSRHWRGGAAASLTVQIPRPADAARPGETPAQTRRDRVVALLAGTPGVAAARALSDAELADLLRPWLGPALTPGPSTGPSGGAEPLSLPLPAVVEVRLAELPPDLGLLAARLDSAAPGTVVESHDVWSRRLSALAWSLQAVAWAALAVVAAVAAAVIAVATRSGLLARRQSIEIVHGLGATDGYIAGRFARRASTLAAAGGTGGAVAALPVILVLAGLAAPFAGPPSADAAHDAAAWSDAAFWSQALAVVPPLLWAALPALPLAACLIGFVTAHATVRAWLRRLP